MPRRGSWTTIISSRCLRCSRRSTVRFVCVCVRSVVEWVMMCFVARERMIGWYHTGPKLRAADLEINELFKRFITRPVMVIVDVRPHTVGIPTDAYFAVEEIKDVRPATLFPPLPY
jgi:proteasome lid subunit RPN8/RPN11